MQQGTANKVLGEFAKFKRLTQMNISQPSATFEQMVRSLADAPFKGIARFQLWTGSQSESFTISIEKGGKTKMEKNSDRKPDLEIITSPETWLLIAQGTLAPLEAFARGLMRVRGDIKLAQQIMNRLAESEGAPACVE